MCLDRVTVRSKIAKKDISGWKVVETAYGLMLSPVAETIINEGVNKAQDLSHLPDSFLGISPVKPGFCIFRRKWNALQYLNLLYKDLLFIPFYNCKIIKVTVPKGTEVSLGINTIGVRFSDYSD